MVVKPNETKSESIQNSHIQGFSLKAVARLVSGQTGNAIFDLSKTILKVILHRDGQQHTICNDSLLPLVIESLYFNGGFAYTQGRGANDFIALNGATSNKLKMLPLAIDFGTVLNIKGDDRLDVELIVNQETFLHPDTKNTENVDFGQCYIQMDKTEGIGLEYRTPSIMTKSISPGESRYPLSLGDNVERITFINTLKDGAYKIQESPLETVQLSSDKLSFSDNLKELLAKRAMMFQAPELANARNHSFSLHMGTELDSAQLDLGFNPQYVAGGENYIVYRTFKTSAKLISQAKRREEKHNAHDVAKIKAA